MMPFTRKNHTFPVVTFRVEATWVAGGARHEKVSMFGFHADNCDAFYVPQPITTRADLRGRFRGPQGQVLERDLSGQITEFGILCRSGAMYARNLADDADFGPFNHTIRELARMLDRGCKVYWATLGSDARDTCRNALIDIMNAKKGAFRPYANWNLNASQVSVLKWAKDSILPVASRPKHALEPRFNFLNLQEYTVITGFGFIQEYEFSPESKRRTYRSALCRLVHVPEAKGRQLFVLIDRDSLDSKDDVSPGDRVSVQIRMRDSKGQFTLSWSGEVIEPRAFSQLSDISIRISKSRLDLNLDHDEHDLLDVQGISSLDALKPGPLTMQGVRKSKTFTVDLEVQPDKQQFERRIRTMACLHETIEWEKKQVDHSVTEQITLANNFQRLPVVDLFAGVSRADIESIRKQLSSWQLDAFDSLHTQHGRLSLIVGPPGSGKSAVLLRATLLHLTSKRYRHPQALLLSPLNQNVDDLMSKVRRLSCEAVVIRLQASRTERALLRPGHFTRVKDRRLNSSNRQASLAHHALVAAGLMRSDSPNLRFKVITERINLGDFVRYYRLAQEGDLGDKDQELFDEATDKLFQWTLGNADVICATMERVADPAFYPHMRPTMIGADEQGNALSAEARVMHAYFPCCHHHVWVGDPWQSGPQVRSPASKNGFSAQLKLSEFTRLLVAGFPAALIKTQRRYCASINDVISPVFYKGEIRTDYSVDRDPTAIKFRRMTKSKMGLSSGNIVLVDIGEVLEMPVPSSKSKINPISAAVSWFMLEKLVQDYEYCASEIGIIAPMRAQTDGHNKIRSQLKANAGKESYEDVLIETWEKIQGTERDILIVDITATNSLRFVSEATRLCTCLSRGKFGIIIVANVSKLYDCDWKREKALSKVMEIVSQREGCIRVDGGSMASIFNTYVPLFPQIKGSPFVDPKSNVHSSKFAAFGISTI